jgi:DNA replication initiation complex subunit (GINS family)
MELDVNSLGELLRKERASPSLQNVSESFYNDLRGLLKEVENKYPPFSRERENHKNLVMDIFNSREKKLVLFGISFARSGEDLDVDNATSDERDFLENFVTMLLKRRSTLTDKSKTGKPDKTLKKIKGHGKQNKPKVKDGNAVGRITLRILQELPPVVGTDGKTYGSFKPEDIVALPRRNAEIFIKHGYGEPIEFDY